MRREAEGSAPELIGPAVQFQFTVENRQNLSYNETVRLDITFFFSRVTELNTHKFRLDIPETELDGAIQSRTT